ncbi:MAG: hypothetical protein ACPGUV_07540, partial [Polyangiales bacterium]
DTNKTRLTVEIYDCQPFLTAMNQTTIDDIGDALDCIHHHEEQAHRATPYYAKTECSDQKAELSKQEFSFQASFFPYGTAQNTRIETDTLVSMQMNKPGDIGYHAVKLTPALHNSGKNRSSVPAILHTKLIKAARLATADLRKCKR